MLTSFFKEGKIVDIVNRRIFCGKLHIADGKIIDITEIPENNNLAFILPGFVDAHIHIESSMVIPSSFAKVAVKHGTIACVCDPHEIANVMGIEGIEFMINNASKVPLKFYFGAPSCVPATNFETSGARLTPNDIESLFKNFPIYFLAEMMNFPGVLFDDKVVYQLLDTAKKFKKPIDGHAPGLIGKEAQKYAFAGITTDHECMSIDEAIEKIGYGMKIQIREGSAAKNFDSLIGLLKLFPSKVMFCSDDKHPDDLLKGHINILVKRAIDKGYDLMDTLRACSFNPINHYNLDVGLLQKYDNADFIVCKDLKTIEIIETYINGSCVYYDGLAQFSSSDEKTINNFNCQLVDELKLSVPITSEQFKVIKITEGSLFTNKFNYQIKCKSSNLESIVEDDILKVVVVNRYKTTEPSIGFINGFGLKSGAIASSVAHDSHNVIAVGTNDKVLIKAINTIISNKGGICYVDDTSEQLLNLPFAGLMSNEDVENIANKYDTINNSVLKSGCCLHSPFMTLSFMSLLVIPLLKIGDKGLFDIESFNFTPLFV